jgi:hypothetical protein
MGNLPARMHMRPKGKAESISRPVMSFFDLALCRTSFLSQGCPLRRGEDIAAFDCDDFALRNRRGGKEALAMHGTLAYCSLRRTIREICHTCGPPSQEAVHRKLPCRRLELVPLRHCVLDLHSG